MMCILNVFCMCILNYVNFVCMCIICVFWFPYVYFETSVSIILFEKCKCFLFFLQLCFEEFNLGMFNFYHCFKQFRNTFVRVFLSITFDYQHTLFSRKHQLAQSSCMHCSTSIAERTKVSVWIHELTNVGFLKMPVRTAKDFIYFRKVAGNLGNLVFSEGFDWSFSK